MILSRQERIVRGFGLFCVCIFLSLTYKSLQSFASAAFVRPTASRSSIIQHFSAHPQDQARHQQKQQHSRNAFLSTKKRFIYRSSTAVHVGIDPQCINDALLQNSATFSTTSLAELSAMVQANSQWLADAVADNAAAAVSDDTSWWGIYAGLFKGGLEFVHSIVDKPLRAVGVDSTWGISIALFTILIRLTLVPLSIEQSKSAEYMKALKPYTKEINEKFAKNEQAKTRAITKLYEDANQNPLSGCLLSLAQIPVFLGLYRGVRLLAIDGELEEPFLWIPSLEGPVSAPDYRGLDWLTSNWVDGAPSLGWEATLAFLSMPLILVFLQSVTMQSLQPPVDDTLGEEEKQTMQKTQTVLRFLPLLIGFFALQVPAGLTIYWFSSNLFTLTQSLAVKAYFAANPPKIELPDYWDSALTGDAENMTPEERRKASEAGLSVGPTFEELIDQSRFHVYVNRLKSSFRLESDAYQRILNQPSMAIVPQEMEKWVEQNQPSFATADVISAPSLSSSKTTSVTVQSNPVATS